MLLVLGHSQLAGIGMVEEKSNRRFSGLLHDGEQV
jgi:hypothetical protein